MYTRLILLSKLLILLSIAPARAQYSFEKTIGQAGSDSPYGMKQASDGYFYLYGQAAGSTISSPVKNYIAKIDHLGNIIWQRMFTGTSDGDCITDLLELPDGSLFCGGAAQEQLQTGNARVTIIKPNGDFILDTLYRVINGGFGAIDAMVNNTEKSFIVSIGRGAGPDNPGPGLMFQKTDYSGKRLWYKYLDYPNDFLHKKIFKRTGKDEYIVFGQRKVLWLDSAGNMLDSAHWAIGPIEGGDFHNVRDIVQNEDGTFTCLVQRRGAPGGHYLQFNDEFGKFVNYGTWLSENTLSNYFALTKTKDKGYFAAGEYFTLVDSNEQIVWKKASGKPEEFKMVSVGQAFDGCFYGSAEDWSKNNNDPDIYIFKTTVDGVIKSGINDVYKQTLKAHVMPNPSAGIFTVTGEFKRAQASITNLLGQQVLHSQGILQGDKLDASVLENGIYILSITEHDNTYVQKINIIK